MASSVDPEAVRGLRKLLQDKLGDRAKRYSEEHLQQLVRRGYDDDQSLRVASREGLLAAGLNDGQTSSVRASKQQTQQQAQQQALQGTLMITQASGS